MQLSVKVLDSCPSGEKKLPMTFQIFASIQKNKLKQVRMFPHNITHL